MGLLRMGLHLSIAQKVTQLQRQTHTRRYASMSIPLIGTKLLTTYMTLTSVTLRLLLRLLLRWLLQRRRDAKKVLEVLVFPQRVAAHLGLSLWRGAILAPGLAKFWASNADYHHIISG